MAVVHRIPKKTRVRCWLSFVNGQYYATFYTKQEALDFHKARHLKGEHCVIYKAEIAWKLSDPATIEGSTQILKDLYSKPLGIVAKVPV